MDVGYIPTGPIIAYLKEVEGERDAKEIARAIRMIRAIDLEYLTASRTKTPPQETT